MVFFVFFKHPFYTTIDSKLVRQLVESRVIRIEVLQPDFV